MATNKNHHQQPLPVSKVHSRAFSFIAPGEQLYIRAVTANLYRCHSYKTRITLDRFETEFLTNIADNSVKTLYEIGMQLLADH